MLPGVRFEKVRVLDFQLDRYFNNVGQYKIKAAFMSLDGNQTVSSEWASFTIREPVGTDLAAYDFLKQQVNTSMFLCCFDSGSVQDLRTFLGIFPESSYSDYARYLLTSHYMLQGETEKVREQLENLQANKDFVYIEEVNEQLKGIATVPKP